MKMYFVFGFGHTDPDTAEDLNNKYVVVCGVENTQPARANAIRFMYGLYYGHWATHYTEEEFHAEFDQSPYEMTEHAHYNIPALRGIGRQIAADSERQKFTCQTQAAINQYEENITKSNPGIENLKKED